MEPYSVQFDTYQPTTVADENAMAVLGIGFILLTFLFAIISYVVGALLLSMIFKKAGVDRWPAWVPIYNNWKLLEIGGQQGFWAVLMLVPVVNIVSVVFLYIAMYQIGLRLGKSGAFVLLAIFLPIVWYIWLAVDSSTWQGPNQAGDTPPYPPQPTPGYVPPQPGVPQPQPGTVPTPPVTPQPPVTPPNNPPQQ